ncbi:glycosyltransferase WbuB [Clostridium folliculivorans]|uniref:Glycosyltransferase WbuB n=1 Tax=Clostridium folliculivorans TaxID=2886038 RepID=A0A9W6DC81_9CLOT|nr:glycosyltransferase family 4 protein [Clostridium folliculivorans]GKU27225.1 glycosyltransferase WbuB [Clostridium folliculivorans]
MKILVVCQYYYPEPFRITDICESLAKRGHDVTVLTGLPNYPEGSILDGYRNGKKRNEILNGVKILRCFEIGRGNTSLKLFLNYLSYAISATIKALLLKERFDVVLVNQLSPVMMVIPAIAYKKKHHKKILLYCLDLWPDSLAAGGVKEQSIIYKIFYKISKWIYKHADTIMVTSSMFVDYFKSTLKLEDIEIRHLPQYAEDLFTEKVSDEFTKSTISRQKDKFNFVFAGNVGDIQSVETIIEAAKELKSYSNIYFHIVGDGSKLKECIQLSNNYGLSSVMFYGRRPIGEMPQFYEMADAMLITLKDNKNLSYTVPGKVQSYMAFGKPIIGCINGETRRAIEESRCGLCCEAEDYKSFASLISKFCNSDIKDDMGSNARKFYFENYSKQKFMSTLEVELNNLGGKNHV